KGVNFLLTNGGTMTDYKGFGKATKPMLPSVGVPTTAGTGSEAQSYALIADESSHLKMACGDRKAAFRVALLDPELTASQPRAVPGPVSPRARPVRRPPARPGRASRQRPGHGPATCRAPRRRRAPTVAPAGRHNSRPGAGPGPGPAAVRGRRADPRVVRSRPR